MTTPGVAEFWSQVSVANIEQIIESDRREMAKVHKSRTKTGGGREVEGVRPIDAEEFRYAIRCHIG